MIIIASIAHVSDLFPNFHFPKHHDRYTGDEKHIYRAFKMAELMQNDKVLEAIATSFDPQRQCQGVADFPYSLMEGLAGTICYHCDLLHPQTAAFPGYDGEVSLT